MSKVLTRELTGAALDWAVAKCEGRPYTFSVTTGGDYNSNTTHGHKRYYSTDWAQGGPIIEREITGVDLVSDWDGKKRWSARKFEYLPNEATRCVEREGPTPLIAAMRCYVAAKMGNEVEIPNELLKELNG